MLIYRHSLCYILLLCCMLLAGCADDVQSGASDSTAPVYLRLSLRIETGDDASRSNPTGGEDGDGREDAVDNEAAINHLDLFFYSSASDNAINDDASAKVKYHMSISAAQLSGFVEAGADHSYLIPLKELSVADGDRVLVFANGNFGKLNNYVGLPISELRDMRPVSTCTGDKPKDATNFTMATARAGAIADGMVDGKIYFSHSGTKSDPFRVQSTIERTAARIDFWYEHSQLSESKDYIEYAVGSGQAKAATVRITHIRPVNVMSQSSWWFKRVTTSLDTHSPLKYCAAETPVNGLPGNYVVEPATAGKTEATADNLAAWFGATASAGINADAFTPDYAVGALNENGLTLTTDAHGVLAANGTWRSLILAYANENTMYGTGYADAADRITGLALRAQYMPTVVYATADVENATDDEKRILTAPVTIYRCRPVGVDSWDASKDVFFTTEEFANAYKEKHPEQNIIISKYTDGVCYYNVWLRHANYDNPAPDTAEAMPMEYAIVRNNIYRLSVSFFGPGTPTPEIRTPKNVRSYIYVRKWNLRTHSEILM